PPGVEPEQPLRRIPAGHRVLRVHVDAVAAPVDLRRAQLDQVQQAVVDARAGEVSLEVEQRLVAAGRVLGGVEACFHDGPPSVGGGMLPRAGYMEPPGVLHSPAQHLISRSTMAAPFSLFVSCAPGLEPLLAAELAELGALGPEALAGGVRASGHRRVVYRANLESGLASHVLVRVGAIVATDLGALEHGL